MKTVLPLLVFSFLFSIPSFSQENGDEYIVNLDVLLLLAQKNKVSDAYHLKKVNTQKQTKKTIKRKSKKHDILKVKIDSLEQVEIAFNAVYFKELETYNTIQSIVNNINSFLSSPKSYEAKKHILLAAQKKAITHNIQELIYADTKINTQNRSKYLVLSLNPIELKIHLRRVASAIKLKNTKPVENLYDTTYLDELRAELSNTNSFYYTKVNGKTKKISRIYKDKKVIDYSHLSGRFKKVNDCYIVLKNFKNKLFKNQIINLEQFENLNLNSSFISLKEFSIILNTVTKKKYLVAKNFLTTYGSKTN